MTPAELQRKQMETVLTVLEHLHAALRELKVREYCASMNAANAGIERLRELVVKGE